MGFGQGLGRGALTGPSGGVPFGSVGWHSPWTRAQLLIFPTFLKGRRPKGCTQQAPSAAPSAAHARSVPRTQARACNAVTVPALRAVTRRASPLRPSPLHMHTAHTHARTDRHAHAYVGTLATKHARTRAHTCMHIHARRQTNASCRTIDMNGVAVDMHLRGPRQARRACTVRQMAIHLFVQGLRTHTVRLRPSTSTVGLQTPDFSRPSAHCCPPPASSSS